MATLAHPIPPGIFEFLVSYLLIMALPGANFLIVADASTRASRGAALAAALGIGCGAMLLALAAVSGVAAFATDPRAMTLGKLLLAAVLIVIGLRALRRACRSAAGAALARTPSSGGYFCLGLLTAATNPITSAFFVSAAINVGPASSFGRAGTLVALVFILASAWFGAIALAFSSRRVRLRYERWRRASDVGIGILLAGFGIVMALRLFTG